ncbi:MAG: tripartite tricarboxylate transporter substrate binding protein [Burkholderiaceae bacterium]|nr:tripartite tricarboxylate transporter substrate binding protein [Burkholderiaceae bacterium]
MTTDHHKSKAIPTASASTADSTSPRIDTGRRAAVAALGSVIAAPFIIGSEARAQATWPNKPVRYINPFPAGGATDTLSRLYCVKMSELTGQQWVVENVGGGGGDIGVSTYARSQPDGYTLGLGGVASHGISPTLKAGKLPFDASKDFTFVSTLWSLPNFLVVNNNFPAATLPELIAVIKKNPGKYNYASAGNGTTLHLSGELFKLLAGLEMTHVPYRGAAPAMVDVIGGQVQMIFDNIPGALAQYKAGKVKGFAVTSLTRSPVAPDIPAIAEFLPGYEVTSWTTVTGPANLPPAVVERISMFTKQALESASIKQDFFDRGATPVWRTVADTVAYRASEEKRLGDIIRRAKISID